MAKLDYQIASNKYDRSRALEEADLAEWKKAVSRFAPKCGGRLLDLGAGTGVFSIALANWFEIDVVAVEPSNGMLENARRFRAHENVDYRAGDAQRIPTSSGTFDIAWLSTVIHHFDDLSEVSKELARILKPEGLVMVRSGFPERAEGISLFRFFPEARKTLSTFPTLTALEEAWAPKFRLIHVEDVPQITASDLASYRQGFRNDLRETDTTLSRLSDGEYEAGISRIDDELQLPGAERPVIDFLTFAVFRMETADE